MPGYYCYLIVNKVHRGTYIGYTSNLARRLRQHNREIKGGARATAHRRGVTGTWFMVATVSGFTSINQAMRFEYHWKHVRSPKTGKMRSTRTLLGRLARLRQLISEPQWSNIAVSRLLQPTLLSVV